MLTTSQRKSLSISEQLELIDDVKVGNLKLSAAAQKYGIGYSTAAKILKKEDDLRFYTRMNGNPSRKRKRQSVYNDINEALTQWFTQACTQGAIVSDQVIRHKATQLASDLEMDFEPNNGWLSRWKQANNISFKKFHGESISTTTTMRTSVDPSSVNEWVTNILPQLFRGYDPRDVWNCDETGMFYRALPSPSLGFAADERSNGARRVRVPKDRLTILHFVNMDGTEKQAVVVGKWAKPRCFKNVKTLPFTYYANHRAWMTIEVFTDVIRTLDQKMAAQNRKIVLFLDNAVCHNLLPGTNLSNVKLLFLPASTTGLIAQPLHRGIVRAFKAHYRRELVRMQVAAANATPPVQLSEVAKQVTILKAMHMLKRALFTIKSSTIRNGFKEAGFASETETKTEGTPDEGKEDEGGDPFSAPSGMEQTDFDEFVGFDDDTQCYGELSDAEEITRGMKSDERDFEFEKDEEAENAGSEVCESEKPVPNCLAALNALETLTAYFEAKSARPDGALKMIYGLYESFYNVNKEIAVK